MITSDGSANNYRTFHRPIWLTTSTFNRGTEDIVVYDSMYASITAFSPSYKLVNTDKLSFSVQMTGFMKQKGSFDCGLFTIYMTHVYDPCII